jgi:hypothetical protein
VFAYPGDPSIPAEYLDLAPLPPAVPPAETDDNDSDGSNTTDSKSKTAKEEVLSLTAGLIISFGQVVLKVRGVIAGGTHVICFVIESCNDNSLAGSE